MTTPQKITTKTSPVVSNWDIIVLDYLPDTNSENNQILEGPAGRQTRGFQMLQPTAHRLE